MKAEQLSSERGSPPREDRPSGDASGGIIDNFHCISTVSLLHFNFLIFLIISSFYFIDNWSLKIDNFYRISS